VRGWLGETELELGSPQQRAVLVMLLLARGRQVSLDGIIDGLWGERLPRSATGTIRTYVSRLRRQLQAGTDGRSGELIESVGDGYALRLASAVLDLDSFEQWLGDAHAARQGHETVRAARLLRDALGLWQGAALAGIPGPYADSRRVRLTELHTAAAEEKLALDIALGEPGVAIAELRTLLAAHPFRERLSELLMLALYQSGRQAEALDVFDGVRQQLRAELGIAPGPSLQTIHQRVLRADRNLMDAADVHDARRFGLVNTSLVA
jgi:DNA-binding SARP family transcriptional activator